MKRGYIMKKSMVAVFIGLIILGTAPVLLADTYGTAPEAEAMVKEAIGYAKAQGKDKAYAEFSNTKGKFVDRDLYIAVYDLKGTVLAHGQNPLLVGKNLIWLKDPDGKAFVKERMELVKTKTKFWQDYKYTDPLTKKIEPKTMYCEKYEESVVCCGIYRR
jgi:cytochrome c